MNIMFVISNKLSICFYMEPKRFYEVLFRGIFAAFPKMESVAMNCNDTCKTIIGDDITKSAKIYCANFVFHGMSNVSRTCHSIGNICHQESHCSHLHIVALCMLFPATTQ